ncbi:hypothetical protein S7711_11117 [Stachybotrys chartarum IBT 7711]|uniref:Uncharacterized protein n=1 Tax=Stachybotrys chartarum (strain CBS 109288 / IBT 7711) TaxID=1280523 RepID=A0A084B331_STACB|nr:hypothetical protein S7711_11117 [Stachybotrys chartarum IBT 7711]
MVNGLPNGKNESAAAGLPPPWSDNIRHDVRYNFFLYVDDRCLESFADATIIPRAASFADHDALVVVGYGGCGPDEEWREDLEGDEDEALLAFFEEEAEQLWVFCLHSCLIELHQWIPDNWDDVWGSCYAKDYWIVWIGTLQRTFKIPKTIQDHLTSCNFLLEGDES